MLECKGCLLALRLFEVTFIIPRFRRNARWGRASTSSLHKAICLIHLLFLNAGLLLFLHGLYTWSLTLILVPAKVTWALFYILAIEQAKTNDEGYQQDGSIHLIIYLDTSPARSDLDFYINLEYRSCKLL